MTNVKKRFLYELSNKKFRLKNFLQTNFLQIRLGSLGSLYSSNKLEFLEREGKERDIRWLYLIERRLI